MEAYKMNYERFGFLKILSETLFIKVKKVNYIHLCIMQQLTLLRTVMHVNKQKA